MNENEACIHVVYNFQNSCQYVNFAAPIFSYEFWTDVLERTFFDLNYNSDHFSDQSGFLG